MRISLVKLGSETDISFDLKLSVDHPAFKSISTRQDRAA